MHFATGVRTDVGRVRSVNEDSVAVAAGLAVVADGMGGHRAGEVASRLAVDAFDGLDAGSDVEALVEAVQRANGAVLERSLGDPSLAGMGTTLCAVGALRGDVPAVGVVNVGDSRVYLLDGGVLRRISEDHSFVETLVREGRLTPEQAEVHPQRNVLTRALGIEPDVTVDAWRVEVADGDRFLLCSDGLFNEVAEATIAEVLARGDDPGATATELVELALTAGARDNVSCVVADVVDSGRAGPLPERSVHRAAGDDGLRPTADEDDDGTGESWLRRGPDPAGTVPTPAAAPRRARRITWRSTVLVLAVLAVLATATGAVAWFARNTWWVKAVDGQVAIYQGPPDGILGISPRIYRQDIAVAALGDGSQRRSVETGVDFGSDHAAATEYVDRLAASTTTSSTTTSPDGTTTTAVAVTSTLPPTTVATVPVPSSTP